MNKVVKIKLNSRIYNLEAILSACYTFIDRAYIFLDSDRNGEKVIVSLKNKKKSSNKMLKHLKEEFMNELLHCCLRYKISKNSKKIREYIVGRALYSVLSDSDLFSTDKELDYQKDPLGIAIPWEEKNKRKKKDARVKIQ